MNVLASSLIIVPAILRIWLVAILLRRGLHRQFRFFFLYNAFAIAAALVKLCALFIGYRLYFVVYWSSEILYVLLELLAILEVFPIAFKAFSLLKAFRRLIWFVAVAMVIVSVLHAILVPPHQTNRLLAWIYSLEIGVRYLQGGIFVLFVVLVRFWQIEWRQYTLGIVLGFGVIAIGTLAPGMLRSEFGNKFNAVFQYVPAVAYIIAVLIWLALFCRAQAPDPLETAASPLRPGEVVSWIKRFTENIRESWR